MISCLTTTKAQTQKRQHLYKCIVYLPSVLRFFLMAILDILCPFNDKGGMTDTHKIYPTTSKQFD